MGFGSEAQPLGEVRLLAFPVELGLLAGWLVERRLVAGFLQAMNKA